MKEDVRLEVALVDFGHGTSAARWLLEPNSRYKS